MVAPTITSLNPSSGRTLGDSLVEIVGADFGVPSAGLQIKVFFGGKEALKADAITPNRILAMAPGGDPGPVDVRVDNITPGVPPAPDVVESTILPGGYTYKRPDLSTDVVSKYPVVALVGRKLVQDLRRTVLENTHWAMDIEYADMFSASFDESKLATAPSLKISGPTITRDRFYSQNNDIDNLDSLGRHVFSRRPFSVALGFDFIGIGRSKAESLRIHEEVLSYFDRTPFLDVFCNGTDDTDGVVQYEMSIVWPSVGRFNARNGRSQIYEFSGSFRIRGVWLFSDERLSRPETEENPTISFTIFQGLG